MSMKRNVDRARGARVVTPAGTRKEEGKLTAAARPASLYVTAHAACGEARDRNRSAPPPAAAPAADRRLGGTWLIFRAVGTNARANEHTSTRETRWRSGSGSALLCVLDRRAIAVQTSDRTHVSAAAFKLDRALISVAPDLWRARGSGRTRAM